MWQGRLIEDIQTEERFFLCNNGSIALYTEDLLLKLLYCFNNPEMFRGRSGWWSKETDDMSQYGKNRYTNKSKYKTLAAITDSLALLIFEPTLIAYLLPDGKLDAYVSVTTFAESNNCTVAYVRRLCRNKRIPGARKIGRNWLIPKAAVLPLDRRTTYYKILHDDSYIE